MVHRLGVEKRHSVYANYADVLFRGASPERTSSASRMGTDVARRCLQSAGSNPGDIGILIACTQSPSRLVPGLAPELMALVDELPRDILHLSLQGQGCSTLLKAIDVARLFLLANPTKRALIVGAEALSPYSSPLAAPRYGSFREAQTREDTQRTHDAVHAFLFGDGAVALLIASDGEGPAMGPMTHLTNIAQGDVHLGRLEGGGSDEPALNGRPRYWLESNLPERVADYASKTLRRMMEDPKSPITSADQAAHVLIHTGSVKILDRVCQSLDIDVASPRVAPCYDVLSRHGNVASVAIGFMLADAVRKARGSILMATFGLSFSASVGVLTAA
jgi:3-oxoacyl-[acyl-carrier-protein] synthase-3